MMASTNEEMSSNEAYFASLAEWARQMRIAQNAMFMCPTCRMMAMYGQMEYRLAGFRQAASGMAAPGHVHGQMAGDVGGNVDGHIHGHMHGQMYGLMSGYVPAYVPVYVSGYIPGRVPPGHAPGFPIVYTDHRENDRLPQLFNPRGGYEYVVAPFLKRLFAEVIDLFIIFLTKITFLFFLIHYFEIEYGKDEIQHALDEELSMNFFKFTSDLFIVDLVCGILVCCYEAAWTVWHDGASPGKSIMKIRIYYAKAVLPREEGNFEVDFEPSVVLIYPTQTPGLFRAIARAVLKQILLRIFFKNVKMMIFFPLSAIVMLLKTNRSVYDLMTSTIVVQTNLRPNYRTQEPYWQ